jgi:hypothetical protein
VQRAAARRACVVLAGRQRPVVVTGRVRAGGPLALRVGRMAPSATLVPSRPGTSTLVSASVTDGGDRVLLHCEEDRCTDG